MKTRTFVYGVMLAVPILAGLGSSVQAQVSVPLGQKFVILNNSGCDVPGGFVQVINSSGTQTLFEKQYGDIPNGRQQTIVAPQQYVGDVLNRNQNQQSLCAGGINKNKGPVTIIYTTVSPCPVPPQNILVPCTVAQQ